MTTRAAIMAAYGACLDDESLRAVRLTAFGDVLAIDVYVDPPASPTLLAALEDASAAIVAHFAQVSRSRVRVLDDALRLRGHAGPRELARLEPDMGPWLVRRMVRDGVVAREELGRLEASARADRAVVELGLAAEDAVTACVARFHRLPALDLASIAPSEVSGMSFPWLRARHVVTLGARDGALVVAVDDPSDAATLEDLAFITGLPLSVHVASFAAIERVLDPAPRADGRCRFCERAEEVRAYDGACEGCAVTYLGVVF